MIIMEDYPIDKCKSRIVLKVGYKIGSHYSNYSFKCFGKRKYAEIFMVFCYEIIL